MRLGKEGSQLVTTCHHLKMTARVERTLLSAAFDADLAFGVPTL